MAKRVRRDHEKEAYWRGHVGQQGHSGLSVRRYCQEHHLSEASFYWWKRELAKGDAERRGSCEEKRTAVSFAEIRITDSDPDRPTTEEQSPGTNIEVSLTGGRTIRLGRGFHEPTFLRVLALLEGAQRC